MDGIVLRRNEGEEVAMAPNRSVLIKADLEQLTVTESWFGSRQNGAGPHIHKRHADSFYVLEGELAFLIQDEEKLLPPNACVCAPPGVVHGFRSTSPARFLNFHTPEGGFGASLRARARGEPAGFDSFDPQADGGRPGSEAILRAAAEGERLEGNKRVATIKIGREELSLVEFQLEPGFEGPEPHSHDDHVDSFYVAEGEPEFLVGDNRLRLGAGSLVAAPPGLVHTFSNPGPGRARLINVHAPSCGFHDDLRRMMG